MAKFQNNNGCSVEITPFMDFCRFLKLKLHESIGGPIAQGFAELEFPNDEKAIDIIEETQYIKVRIEQNEGIIYNIDGLITSKKILDNILQIRFLCIKNISFIDETLTISSLYK